MSHNHKACADHVRHPAFGKRLCVNVDRIDESGTKFTVSPETARREAIEFADSIPQKGA